MTTFTMGTRILIILVASLLALPIVQTASPAEAKNRARSVTRTIRNPAPLNLPVAEPEPISASVYPSPIAVSGMKGRIRDVDLTLKNFAHEFPDNVEVLLVGPSGQTAIVMAHVGSVYDVADVTLRLDDEAADSLPQHAMLQNGTFRPTHQVYDDIGNPIVFNPPAPIASPNVSLSIFDGTNPNGTWRLFVQDLERTDAGVFAGGWELEITTKVKAKKYRQ